MEYRRLGKAGIKLSELSFGAWVTFGNQMGIDEAANCLAAAYDAGVNFFDNAEVYAGGKAEEVMGAALKKLSWRRGSYMVSTKFYWGLHDGVNERNTLNRKRLLEAIDGSLQRFGLDYIDLIYCHRPDPETPIEETVRAMSDIIDRGKAIYWGTSEWSAGEIRAAWLIADKYGWHKPQMEQPQYNLFEREKVENEFSRLYEDIGIGLTTFSPLASGMLTGKYINGIPKDSRGALDGYDWLKASLTNQERIEKVKKLMPIAKELGCTMAQLAIAWCAKNPNVTTVMTGASRVEQVKENMKAIEVLPKLVPDLLAQIDEIAK